MLTLQKLKELRLSYRKNPIIYNLLSTVIGECEQISKNPTTTEIICVLQKMYKDNNTTLNECSVERIDKIKELNCENNFIKQYLPVQLNDSELTALIGSQISSGANLPKIMKYLSTNYKGRYDSKKVISIINSLL